MYTKIICYIDDDYIGIIEHPRCLPSPIALIRWVKYYIVYIFELFCNVLYIVLFYFFPVLFDESLSKITLFYFQ